MSEKNRNIIRVLIGCDKHLVFELRRKYGGKVHIFGDSCDILVRLLPYTRFHLIWEMTPETLSMHLNGFAELNGENIVVVTASDKYAEMLRAAESEIESNCIVMREGLEL